MKKIITFLLVFIFTITLSSCSGYNKIMRNHLSDPNSYCEYIVEVHEIFISQYDSNKLIIDVRLFSKEEVAKFNGLVSENLTFSPEEYLITFEVIGENVKEVYDNGLIEYIKPSDIIKIVASNLIYMDGEFFYIIGLSKDNKEYLNKDIGLTNLIAYMNENKSLF
jgi:hypothetical protein